MYDEHFGLTARPFQLTPDPAFWYETATHRRAMAYLGYGLAQEEGFIVITGDIGAGKTTLMRHLADTLDREALNPITVVSTAIDPADLLRIVAQGLGVDPAGLPKAALLTAIERGLHAVARTGRRTLLVVDEAQALPTASLEELRMLSNFQAGGHALLQIVLLGQPEFRDVMGGAKGLEQLRQRVIATHHLDPMAADEVADYIRHRLSVAGWTGRPGFAPDAFGALHRYSDGVPRRLNQLANRVMLHAAVEEVDTIDAATVDTVAADLFGDLPVGQLAPVAAVHQEPVSAVGAPSDEPTAEVAEPVAPPAVEQAPELAAAPVDDESSEPEPTAATAPPSATVIRPFRHSWLAPVEPLADAVDETKVNAPVPEAAVAPSIQVAGSEPTLPADKPIIETAETEGDHAAEPPIEASLAARLAALETKVEEQDEALRRVLTLMVDWMEGDHTASAVDPIVQQAEPEALGYVPIRGAAA